MKSKKIHILVLSILLLPGFALAQNSGHSEDTYTAKLRQSKYEKPAAVKRAVAYESLLALPALPFDILNGGISRVLEVVETHHIDDKIKWLYEELQYNGIYPNLGGLSGSEGMGGGTDLDWVKLSRQNQRFPFLLAKSGIRWHDDRLFDVHSELGLDQIDETGPSGHLLFRYTERPEEDFFGIGPDTSRGDSASYKEETLKLGAHGNYAIVPEVNISADFYYKDTDIQNGGDSGKGKITEYPFPSGPVPGLRGAEFLVWGLQAERNTLDYPEDAHKGTLTRLSAHYYEGVDSSPFSFFKYRGEFSWFRELLTERHVLAMRMLGEHNDERNKSGIPFFEMARLGGYGVSPSTGDTHRGFQRNRFFGESSLLMNLEYRYQVWKYRELSMDAVLFWDEGQVFNEFSEFQFKDFRESYGWGLRVKVLHNHVLSFHVAKSDEGFNYYLRTKTAF